MISDKDKQYNTMFEIIIVALYGNWLIGVLDKITFLPENNAFQLQIILLGLMFIVFVGYFATSGNFFYMIMHTICLVYISFLEYAELEFLRLRNQITIYDQTKGIAFFAIGLFLWVLLVISDPKRQSYSDFIKQLTDEIKKKTSP